MKLRKNTNEQDPVKKRTNEKYNLDQIEQKTKELDVAVSAVQATVEVVSSSSWPVGSVYFSIVSTNPATLLGFGTWTQIAPGQFIVGQKTTDVDFDTAEETGGAKTKNLAHTHKVNPPNTTTSDPSTSGDEHATDGSQRHTRHPHTHDVDIAEFDSGSGGSATQDILPPYFVCYIWKRVS